MRADAQRNYERILAVAIDTVARDGAEVSLEAIARQAGVGSATLHRHFASRAALLHAVFHDRVAALSAQAVALAAEPDAAAALVTWLRALGAYASSTRGMPVSMLPSAQDNSCHAMLTQAGGTLLGRAQAAGGVRPEVAIQDLLALVTAISLAGERTPKPGSDTDRLLMLALDGIRR
jgi:AcrR family transcriptional regulator